MPSLNHQEQQEAAERIHQLMEQGMSSGEAIARVAQEIREKHQGERVAVLFDEEDADDGASESEVQDREDVEPQGEDDDDY
ncbi:YoaH family protein [Serratia rhizosphaerae]|uniref:YoaH family protein n=1 Tax=Serratia rhizosphaerae TaxID=2597702 RepID=A0ABX6GUN2_9GAMM|nr:YoaH family protein [Serratia rhizosphaerae]QHA89968.1 YoaH family protein [Serratia rhizosphaerae]